ncbi:MAG: dihydroorotate dehydrogenase electron transfer subunit [Treponema sp.]|nr:dihydroorotate dehydrogenase electron transfer subunit [Treponema sp.]
MSSEGSGSGPKRSFFCECTSSYFVAGDTVRMEFIWPGPAPRGGQFFLIRPRRTGVFLGRPVSVAGWKPSVPVHGGEEHSHAEAGGMLHFLVIRRGQGSRELTDLRPGEEAELTGPLGNSWDAADIPEGPVALVGGGVGIAPLLAAVPEMGKRPFDFYAGFRTGSYGLDDIKTQSPGPRSIIIATEDGSLGLKGRIPDFFTPSGYSGVFACGPEPMLRAVGDACIACGIPCFISMEKRMACGVGACLGCTVKTTRGNRRCCADGPVFNAEEVCFDRQGT